MILYFLHKYNWYGIGKNLERISNILVRTIFILKIGCSSTEVLLYSHVNLLSSSYCTMCLGDVFNIIFKHIKSKQFLSHPLSIFTHPNKTMSRPLRYAEYILVVEQFEPWHSLDTAAIHKIKPAVGHQHTEHARFMVISNKPS